jgi:hypothetical protein
MAASAARAVPSLAYLASAAFGLLAAGAHASPFPLHLYCEPQTVLAAGFVAIDSEAGVSEDADSDDCSAPQPSGVVASVDTEGAVRHRLHAEARIGLYLAEVTNDLELEVDGGAAGSLSATASASVIVVVQSAAELSFRVQRTGAFGEVLSATLEGPAGIESFDFSDEPEGATVVRLEPLQSDVYYIALHASSALEEAGSSRQELSVEVYAPEPGAPLLVAVGALVLAGARRRAPVGERQRSALHLA